MLKDDNVMNGQILFMSGRFANIRLRKSQVNGENGFQRYCHQTKWFYTMLLRKKTSKIIVDCK